MNVKKMLSVLVCIILIVAGFVVIGTENATSDFTISIKDDPYPKWSDLAVFGSEISVDEPLFVGQKTTIDVIVHNLGIAYAVTWHNGDYAEYDFYQGSDQILDIKIRIRSYGDATDTGVNLDGTSIASFNSMPEYDIITIHNVTITTGEHTIRITQNSDSPAQGDDLFIDWLEIGDNRIQGECYDRSYGTVSNPGYRGVDNIHPSAITVKFSIDEVLISQNDHVGSHVNSVPGGYPYPEAYFIPNNGSTNTSASWVPSTPGYHTIKIGNVTGICIDSNITNNIAYKTVFIGSLLPPTLYINISQDKKDAVLNWEPPPVPEIDHYLIYRSTSQTGFDFDTVWKNTSFDKEVGESSPIPLRTIWNDTNAAYPKNITNYNEQYYYIIRAVNKYGQVSSTSRTVGKWTRGFTEGISSFSLPLEPMDTLYINNLTSDMGAEYVKYLNYTTHQWTKHDLGEGNNSDVRMKMGEGYEVKFLTPTNYSFCGMPGAMISYNDISLGFNASPTIGDAQNLSVSVDGDDNVILVWQIPEASYENVTYRVYRSESRDGFWGVEGTDYVECYCENTNTPGAWVIVTDPGIALPGTEHYYMIVPIDNSTGQRGVSSYSVGVWVEEYLSEYDTMGIPLKIGDEHTADWFCDNIPNTTGINYYSMDYRMWLWHTKRMPKGAFDSEIKMTYSYQISTCDTTEFTFIGI